MHIQPSHSQWRSLTGDHGDAHGALHHVARHAVQQEVAVDVRAAGGWRWGEGCKACESVPLLGCSMHARVSMPYKGTLRTGQRPQYLSTNPHRSRMSRSLASVTSFCDFITGPLSPTRSPPARAAAAVSAFSRDCGGVGRVGGMAGQATRNHRPVAHPQPHLTLLPLSAPSLGCQVCGTQHNCPSNQPSHSP